MSAVVTIAFLFGLAWGFMILALLIAVTFFEFERKEVELEEINLAAVGYFSRNSFSIGVALTTVGMALLSPAFLIKGGGAYWYEWQKGISRILYALQFRLFLISILLLVVGLFLIQGGRRR